MRRCTYCKQLVEEKEEHCRYCAQHLGPSEAELWYFSRSFFLCIFLCIGPLALPLLFANPGFSKRTKLFTAALLTVIWLTAIALLLRILKDAYSLLSNF